MVISNEWPFARSLSLCFSFHFLARIFNQEENYWPRTSDVQTNNRRVIRLSPYFFSQNQFSSYNYMFITYLIRSRKIELNNNNFQEDNECPHVRTFFNYFKIFSSISFLSPNSDRNMVLRMKSTSTNDRCHQLKDMFDKHGWKGFNKMLACYDEIEICNHFNELLLFEIVICWSCN